VPSEGFESNAEYSSVISLVCDRPGIDNRIGGDMPAPGTSRRTYGSPEIGSVPGNSVPACRHLVIPDRSGNQVAIGCLNDVDHS
jgi:hypothetical protein